MEMDSKYHVGDKVRVIDDYLDIDTDNEERDERVGKSATIRRVQWCDVCNRYEYRISGSGLIWCDDNFEFDIQDELPSFDVSEVNILDLFS